ncbi:MAG: TraB/TrbI/VirB10 family type IV secretion system protein [Acidobacteriaceae bacterium]
MKPMRARILGLMMLSIFCYSAMAQQADTAVRSQDRISEQANRQIAAAAAASVPMTQVPAHLETKLDTRKSKVGDAVVAKTTKAVKTAQGIKIPKGSKLLGTVTKVQAQTPEQEQSLLTIRFDRVQLHNGQQISIRTMIDNVYRPALPMPLDKRVGNSATQNQVVGPIGGAGMSGRRVGEGEGPETVAIVAPRMEHHAWSTARSAKEEKKSVLGNSEWATAASGPQGLLWTDHVASFPGILLSGAASSRDSTTLSATDRNIHLDCGTQLLLSIAVQP